MKFFGIALVLALVAILPSAQHESDVQPASAPKPTQPAQWKSRLPIEGNERLYKEYLGTVHEDFNGDGYEDVLIYYCPKVTGFSYAHIVIVAYDGSTGVELWRQKDTEVNQIFQCQAFGRWIIYEGDSRHLYLLDGRSGKRRSEFELLSKPLSAAYEQFQFHYILGERKAEGTEVLMLGAPLNFSRVTKALYVRIPNDDKEPLQRFDLEPDFPGAFSESRAYLIQKQVIKCLDRITGKTIWEKPREGGECITGGAADNEVLALYGGDGHIFTLSATTGDLLWRRATKKELPTWTALLASPVLGPNSVAVYEGYREGVSILDKKDGTRLANVAAKPPVYLSPPGKKGEVIIRDNTVTKCYGLSDLSLKWSVPLQRVEINWIHGLIMLISRWDDRVAAVSVEKDKVIWTKEMPLTSYLGQLLPDPQIYLGRTSRDRCTPTLGENGSPLYLGRSFSTIYLPTPIGYASNGSFAIVYGGKDYRVVSLETGAVVQAYTSREWVNIIPVLHNNALIFRGDDGLFRWKEMESSEVPTKVWSEAVPFQFYSIAKNYILFIDGQTIRAVRYPWSVEAFTDNQFTDELTMYLEHIKIAKEYFTSTN